MGSVVVANVSRSDDPGLVNLSKVLHEKTFMNLGLKACAVGGSFDVSVENRNGEYTDMEVAEMALSLLADSVMRS